MARDSNPDHPGEDGVWFTVRKDGEYINLPSLSNNFSTDDPTVGWIPLSAFRNMSSSAAMRPSAAVFIGIANKFTSSKYDLYEDKNASTPLKNTDTLNLAFYGLKKNNGIVLEVKNDNSDKDGDDGDKDGNDGDKDGNDGDNGGNDGDKGSNDGNDGDNGDKGSNNGDGADKNDGDDGDNGSNNGDGADKNDDKDDNNNDKDGKDGDGNDGNGNNGNNGDGREYHPDYPGKYGYWFVVQDDNDNNIDVSNGATAVDKDDSTLGWNPLPKDPDLPSDIWHAGAGLVKRGICHSLGLDPRDYQVYTSQADKTSDFIGDNYVIDFRDVGLRGNNPMMVKYYIVKNTDGGSDNEDNDQGNNGGDNEDNGQGNDSGNNDGNTVVNTDPYVNFTKRLQNITTGDWSIYPEAIRGTYSGEILWTDGNPSHSFASAPNIQAYSVVRRNPSVYNGTVIATGLASTSPYYFKLLG